jgi:DNA-binding CsgD family transcriptional regulator
MLVGRQRELDLLVQCLDDVPATGGLTMLVSGESGIGKTSLLASFREIAIDRNCIVASFVSNEGVWAPPYATWNSIFAQLVLDPLPTAAARDDQSPEEHRFRIHHAALETIRGAAADHTVVIVLDDIQWMDQPSRDILAHLIPHLGASRVLLVGAWRSPVTGRDPHFSTFVANLRRDPAVRWLELTGMNEPDVTAMVRHLGWAATPGAIHHLMAETNGNPFFIAEIARFQRDSSSQPITDSDDLLTRGIPPSIRDVVRLRFNGLPETTRQMLSVAAIFTQGFDFQLLREMTDLAEDDLLDAIDDALASDFLRPTDRRPEHYDFAHAIVRESIAANWSPSRRARLHRRAAEALERLFAGRESIVAGDLALQYFASRSIEGAARGVEHAITSAEKASQSFDFAQAAELLSIASELAITEPLSIRADVEWRRALALTESIQVEEAAVSAERAIEMLRDSGASNETIANVCWRLAHSLNASGASAAVRNRLKQEGLRALGERRDIHWARLRLLGDPIETVPNDVLFAAKWVGYDPEAQQIARESTSEEDQVQTIETFDIRTPDQTRDLIARARAWSHPRASLRGLTVAANDLTYRYGEFRLGMTIWNEVLTLARRVGAIPWQGNALNQITLLHVTLGEFDLAVKSKRTVDEINAMLGPANDAEALQMERDFALTHYLDGDWPHQASYWLHFVGDPPHGLETQLAVPLYAAMAASAAATAGIGAARAQRLIDALAGVATHPGIQQVNGVVAWAADAIAKLGAEKSAATYDRLAADLIASGMSDYPQTSLHLTRARMLTLLGDPHAQRMFEQARETLAIQGQTPLLGIACYEQGIAAATSTEHRKTLLQQAIGIFERLGMTTWHERASNVASTAQPEQVDLAGVTRRELEVLRLVAKGYSDRRIADELFVSERTVNAHVRNMLQKTEAENRTELSIWARGKGVLEQ